MRSTGTTRLAGVLGWPLEHTLSPAIHNAAFARLGLDAIYLAWPVPPADLEPAVAGLRALRALGANVTMPHKEAVMAHLDDVSADARAVGAVNTIALVGGRLIGHNTDVSGFRTWLIEDAGAEVAGRNVLVLGSGGAARAVVRAAAELGAGAIHIAARRTERGESLVALGGSRTKVVPWDEAGEVAGRAAIIVNATPLGTRGEEALAGATFGPGQVVVDLIYEPPSTPLIESARAAGAAAWGGLGMLVHQAGGALRIWTGQEPPLDALSGAALHAIGGRGHRSGPIP